MQFIKNTILNKSLYFLVILLNKSIFKATVIKFKQLVQIEYQDFNLETY